MRLDFDEPEGKEKMKGYEKLWLIGALLAVVGACGIDSAMWYPFSAAIGCGCGLILGGLWIWRMRRRNHED